jgi:hypothetical protein
MSHQENRFCSGNSDCRDPHDGHTKALLTMNRVLRTTHSALYMPLARTAPVQFGTAGNVP